MKLQTWDRIKCIDKNKRLWWDYECEVIDKQPHKDYDTTYTLRIMIWQYKNKQVLLLESEIDDTIVLID